MSITVESDIPELQMGDILALRLHTMEPSNNCFVNPTAMKAFFETGGKSAINGLKNMLTDMTENGGLPSSVDKSKFTVGQNLAVTPGHVVFRNDVIELIHYTANTDKVMQRPPLVVPPQINKYYSIDMPPAKA